MVHLLLDFHEHKDGRLFKHKAGAWIDVPQPTAEFLAQATLDRRQRLRAIASQFALTPEGQRR